MAEALIVRIGSLAVVFAILAAVPFSILPLLAIAFGQGHYFLAYLYQAEGGHLSRMKLLWLGTVLLLLTLFALFGPFAILAFATGVGFVIHFCVDEVRLWEGKHSFFTTLESIPFIVFMTGIFAEAYLKADWTFWITAIVMAVIALYLVLSFFYRRFPGMASYALYGWTLLAGISYVFVRFAPGRAAMAFWAVSLLHYAIWYGFYWYKLQHALPARAKYVRRSVIINAVLLALVFLWRTFPALGFLSLFFGTGFYVWSLLHGIASMRPREVAASFSFKS